MEEWWSRPHRGIFLITEVWNREMPSDWQKNIICPVSKKKVTVVCNNCRGILLLHGPVNYLHL